VVEAGTAERKARAARTALHMLDDRKCGALGHAKVLKF
jgi:hypothetical protein